MRDEGSGCRAGSGTGLARGEQQAGTARDSRRAHTFVPGRAPVQLRVVLRRQTRGLGTSASTRSASTRTSIRRREELGDEALGERVALHVHLGNVSLAMLAGVMHVAGVARALRRS